MSDTRSPNSAQLEAVHYEGGPLVVLAGPGTGKTFVITHRIAHLVQEGGLEPDSILALTFTVKAAAELRERLGRLIGPETAQRIQAHTFNGYGMRLVQRFAHVLGLPPRLTMIDAVQRRRILKDLVLTHGLFPESRAEGLRTLLESLERAMEGMANLGALPPDCQRAAAAWSSRIAGDQGEHARAESAACERFASESRLYGLYNSQRRPLGLIGYSDQISLPIELLRAHPGPAAILRSEVRAVIVDEFQDCNPGQIELLRLLMGPGLRPGHQRVCVVGDDDQAIYMFRGADDRAFQRFESIWPNPKVIALTENYRSQAPIIRVVNKVIAGSHSRFRPDKTLEFASGREPAASTVEAVKLSHDFDDGEVIAAMILQERDVDAPPPWSDFAVIARTHGDLDRIAAALTICDIPFEKAGGPSPIDDDGVQDVLAWIEWVVNPDSTWPLLRILSRPPHGVPAEQAAEWDRRYRAQRSKYDESVAGVSDPGRYVDWLSHAASAGGAYEPALRRVLDTHRELRRSLVGVRGDQAVWKVITGIDAAHAELLPARERAARVSALVALIGLAREKQTRLPPPGDLRQFLEYFQELRDTGDLKPQADVDQPAERREDEDGQGRVQLMTAHASKGLEFPLVFVPRLTPRFGYPKSRDDNETWRPPPELLNPLDERDPATRMLDEERRLLYVACTRAERRLVVMAKYNRKPSGSAAHFFEELVPHGAPPLVDAEHTAEEVLTRASQAGLGPPAWSGPEALERGASKDAAEQQQRALAWAARLRRQARLEAAAALEAANAGNLSADAIEEIQQRLVGAAHLMGTIASVERTGKLPGWVKGPEVRRAGEELAAAFRDGQGLPAHADPFSVIARPLKSPLDLSFTYINEYLKCPRCFYLHRQLGLEQESTWEASVGTIIHETLRAFYQDWSEAEADGRERPGLKVLLAMGREALHSQLTVDQGADRGLTEQVLAQLTMAWTKLHEDNTQVLELERTHIFEYTIDKIAHRFTAKLDRLDRLPDNGLRVVDYKTGKPTKTYTEPKPDDLQLGIYLIALQHAFNSTDFPGVAEYWVLAQGVRGCIPFADIRLDKVRATIDGAVRGMLAGEFPMNPKCEGVCALFA